MLRPYLIGDLLELLRAGEDGVRVDGVLIHGHLDCVDDDLPVDRCDAKRELRERPHAARRLEEAVRGTALLPRRNGHVNPIALAVLVFDRVEGLAGVEHLKGCPRGYAAVFESILQRPVDVARHNLEGNRHISRIEIVDDLKSFLGEIEICGRISFVAVRATVDHFYDNRFFRACWARARDLNALAACFATPVIVRETWGPDHPIRICHYR